MNVLVTGGAGYIGSHACVELLNAGHSVVVVDNLVNANAECLRRVERITGKTLEFHEMDLLNRAALNELFDTHRFDCVLHFAGLKAVGESVQQPLRYYNNNLGTTIHLCQTMAAHGVKKILFSSSATVYSPDNTMPVDESARTGGCTNPYGWTKYMSEQILSDTAKADGEWSVMLLRYFNPVGAHPSGLIGEDPRGIPNNLMPYISQVAIGRRDRRRTARVSERIRQRLSHAGRHGRARLSARRRSRARPCRGDGLYGGAEGCFRVQSRHRPRLQRARHGACL